MKNYLIITLIFIHSTISLCQEKKDSTSKWSLGAASTLNYTRYNYIKSSPDNQVKNYFVISPGVNLIAQRKLSNFFSLDVGINYFRLATKRSGESTYISDMSKTKIDFIGVPLLFHTNLGKKNFYCSINLGIELVILANSVEKYQKSYYSGLFYFPEQIKNNGYASRQLATYSNIGLQLNYRFNERFTAFINVCFNYTLQPFYQGKYDDKINYFKLPVGFTYKLKKCKK